MLAISHLNTSGFGPKRTDNRRGNVADRIRERLNRFLPGKERVGRIDRAMQVRVHIKPSRAMNLCETYAIKPSSVNKFSILVATDPVPQG